MNASDEIDFLLTLEPHGWSACRILVNDKVIELTITHVFGDPYWDFMEALSQLIKGERVVTFFWFGEPGGERIEIERLKDRQHFLNIRIDGFYESFGDEIEDFEPTIHFEIKERQFLILSYYQLKKIEVLLSDTSFAKNRGGDFPLKRFKAFESEVINYLKIP